MNILKTSKDKTFARGKTKKSKVINNGTIAKLTNFSQDCNDGKLRELDKVDVCICDVARLVAVYKY